ncbi:PREDICTED: PR domain zinc finger protein 13 [Haliaeetus leucocephalus]|uniref:PR domain zinc finger protein 13 n=1 Tax=Haliaeetus leucocephalus TaxID=52644 RepID=UPI00053CAAE3|nr:PREDICTED: PR domain zinc finger protein 13 [Haliaeetus leucocephalus]
MQSSRAPAISVSAESCIPAGLRLGPVPGIFKLGKYLSDRREPGPKKKVRMVRGELVDEAGSSALEWIGLIRAARNSQEQTLEAVADLPGGQIFYRALRDVQPGEELTVWYSNPLAQWFDIPVTATPTHDEKGFRNTVVTLGVPRDGCRTGAELGKAPGRARWRSGGGRSRRSRHAFAEDDEGQTAPLERPAKATEGRRREPAGRVAARPSARTAPSPVFQRKSVGLRPRFPPTPRPGRHPPASLPPRRGEKPRPTTSYRCTARGPPLDGERGRAAHHGEDTGDETQATALDPRTRESEAFVFHPHPADPRPKCWLKSPPGRLVAASVSASVTRAPSPGAPAAAERIAARLCPTSPPIAPQGTPRKPKTGHLCLYCGKLYSRKYGLKIHMRTHTGYKPLKCKVCLRPFGDPSNLNKHIRLHAKGNTPYRCEYCGKVLVRRRDLERHVKSRHPGQSLGKAAEDKSDSGYAHPEQEQKTDNESDVDVCFTDDQSDPESGSRNREQ